MSSTESCDCPPHACMQNRPASVRTRLVRNVCRQTSRTVVFSQLCERVESCNNEISCRLSMGHTCFHCRFRAQNTCAPSWATARTCTRALVHLSLAPDTPSRTKHVRFARIVKYPEVHESGVGGARTA